MVHEGLRVPCGAAARVPAGPRTSPAWPAGGSVETISRFDTPSELRRSAGPDELPLVAVALHELGVDRRRERRIVELEREVFGRSEEHTSELQSLMRISYAVICLKKKKNK